MCVCVRSKTKIRTAIGNPSNLKMTDGTLARTDLDEIKVTTLNYFQQVFIVEDVHNIPTPSMSLYNKELCYMREVYIRT